MRIAILGAGAWGTALAVALSARHETVLWMRDPEQCKQLQATRLNQRYLPDIALPEALQFEQRSPLGARRLRSRHRGRHRGGVARDASAE